MKHLFSAVGSLLAKKTHGYYMDLGARALSADNLPEAEKNYTRALELAEEAKAHDAVAEISKQLGFVCQKLDKLAVAETHFRRAYQSHEDSDQYAASADCLMLLGSLYQKQRRFPDAEQVLQYAMSIHQSHFGNQAPGIVKAASCLAECYLSRGSFAEAEKLLTRAIEIEESKAGDKAQLAVDNYMLALAYAGQAKGQAAEAAFNKAGQLFDRLTESSTAELAHKACACWHHLGKFLCDAGRSKEAVFALDKALSLAEQFPGYLDEADLADMKAKAGA